MTLNIQLHIDTLICLNPLLDRGDSGAPLMVFFRITFVRRRNFFFALRYSSPIHTRTYWRKPIPNIFWGSWEKNFLPWGQFLKTEDVQFSVYRYIKPDVSQLPWHIGTKFQRLPPYFWGPGSQWYYCGYFPMRPEVGISRWRPPNRGYL